MKLFQTSAALSCALIMSACTLAPSYERPDVGAFDIGYPQSSASHQAVAVDSLGWQDYFTDPYLKALIQTALLHNRNLKMAALNADMARAQYGISLANLAPVIGVTASKTRAGIAPQKSPTGESVTMDNYQVGLGVSGWELDLFGKMRSLSNAAIHQYFAAQYGRDAAQLSLIAAVAKTYFAQRVAKESMQLTENIWQSRQKSYDLAKLSYDAGLISALDYQMASTQMHSAAASFAEAKNNYQNAENALLVLIGGQWPQDLPNHTELEQQFLPNDLLVGLPSELLTRRPDIRQQEEMLQAANAQIGAARAAFFPSISLTGNYGWESDDLNHLISSAHAGWSFVPRVNLPIFTFGRNKANLDISQLRKHAAIAQYEQTVQEAFKEVADVLHAKARLDTQLVAQQQIAAATREVLRLTEMRHKEGMASALELLDAQRQSDSAQMMWLQTQLQSLNNRVDLYKALGGGVSEPKPTATSL